MKAGNTFFCGPDFFAETLFYDPGNRYAGQMLDLLSQPYYPIAGVDDISRRLQAYYKGPRFIYAVKVGSDWARPEASVAGSRAGGGRDFARTGLQVWRGGT